MNIEIIKYYGVDKQQRKLAEEVFELQEAISKFPFETTLENILEEIADVKVILEQFIEFFDLDQEEIKQVMNYKIKRTLERIK